MDSGKISGLGAGASMATATARAASSDAGQSAPARSVAPAVAAATATAGRSGAATSAQAEAANALQEQKKAAPPPASNGMQFVYVFDDQQHRNVVKIVDIQTQKVMPDPPQEGADAQLQDAQGAEAAGAATPRIDTRA